MGQASGCLKIEAVPARGGNQVKDAAKFARSLPPQERMHFIEAEEHRIKSRMATLKLTDPNNKKEQRQLKRELSAIEEVRLEGLGAALAYIASKRKN
jgi:hypothetical protein